MPPLNRAGAVPISIEPVRSRGEFGVVADLFREYQAWLDAPVCFQEFQQELSSLPGPYKAPQGELWLARSGREIVGVVGMKPASSGTGDSACEMKRLYVRDSWRGHGIGRMMAETSIRWARQAGYESVCLETLGRLHEARSLYRSLGFVEPSIVTGNSLETPIFMEFRFQAKETVGKS